MLTFDKLSLEQLQRIKKTFNEIIGQVGKLVVQDYNALLVLLPGSIEAEIQKKIREGGSN